MKHQTKHMFTLNELMTMPALHVRIPHLSPVSVSEMKFANTSFKLLKAPNGDSIPYPPGLEECELSGLPKNHPARFYLEQTRGYNLEALEKQFGASWCETEYPEDPYFEDDDDKANHTGVYYPRWAGGWKSTPQGRVVFRALKNGICYGWQARLPEFTNEEGELFWYHPYSREWTLVGKKDNDGKIQYLPDYETDKRPPSKYRNAVGMQSGNLLFGLDHVQHYLKSIPFDKRYVVLTEGPLDAARFPNHGLAFCRAYLNPVQARILGSLAKTVVFAMDNDDKGQETRARNISVLMETCQNIKQISPAPAKDFGELGYTKSEQILNNTLQQ